MIKVNSPVSIILAGGFGTRMLDAGISKAKGLFNKNGVPIIQLTAGLLSAVTDDIYMITNERFIGQYRNWLARSPFAEKINIISNGISLPEKRAGALGDLANAIRHFELEKSGKNIIVAPSDTLISETLDNFALFCGSEKSKFSVIFEKKGSPDEIKRRLGCGVIEGGKVISFVEKPENPLSLYAVVPFYYYPYGLIPHFFKYLKEGNNPDAPSNIIPWLIKNGVEIRAYVTKGRSLDVGTPEDIKKLESSDA